MIDNTKSAAALDEKITESKDNIKAISDEINRLEKEFAALSEMKSQKNRVLGEKIKILDKKIHANVNSLKNDMDMRMQEKAGEYAMQFENTKKKEEEDIVQNIKQLKEENKHLMTENEDLMVTENLNSAKDDLNIKLIQNLINKSTNDLKKEREKLESYTKELDLIKLNDNLKRINYLSGKTEDQINEIAVALMSADQMQAQLNHGDDDVINNMKSRDVIKFYQNTKVLSDIANQYKNDFYKQNEEFSKINDHVSKLTDQILELKAKNLLLLRNIDQEQEELKKRQEVLLRDIIVKEGEREDRAKILTQSRNPINDHTFTYYYGTNPKSIKDINNEFNSLNAELQKVEELYAKNETKLQRLKEVHALNLSRLNDNLKTVKTQRGQYKTVIDNMNKDRSNSTMGRITHSGAFVQEFVNARKEIIEKYEELKNQRYERIMKDIRETDDYKRSKEMSDREQKRKMLKNVNLDVFNINDSNDNRESIFSSRESTNKFNIFDNNDKADTIVEERRRYGDDKEFKDFYSAKIEDKTLEEKYKELNIETLYKLGRLEVLKTNTKEISKIDEKINKIKREEISPYIDKQILPKLDQEELRSKSDIRNSNGDKATGNTDSQSSQQINNFSIQELIHYFINNLLKLLAVSPTATMSSNNADIRKQLSSQAASKKSDIGLKKIHNQGKDEKSKYTR